MLAQPRTAATLIETLDDVAYAYTLDTAQGKRDDQPWHQELSRLAKSQGWTVSNDSKGYTRFHNPEGDYVGYYPATPSNSPRRMVDLKVALKAAGLRDLPPSTMEQRSMRRKQQERTVTGMWVTAMTYNGPVDEDTLVAWGEQLEEHDGSVAAMPGRGFTVTVWTDVGDVKKATAHAMDLAEAFTSGHLAAIETMTKHEYERRADEPHLPELVSAPEVADLLGGISRQRVHQLQHNVGFPEPLLRLRTGPIWDARAIRRFADSWARQPGRPAKSA